MVDAVVHPLAFAACADDAGAAQVGEVAGNLGLALVENLNEVTDADFAVAHEIKQAQAGAVAERGEHARHVEGVAGHGVILL